MSWPMGMFGKKISMEMFRVLNNDKIFKVLEKIYAGKVLNTS